MHILHCNRLDEEGVAAVNGLEDAVATTAGLGDKDVAAVMVLTKKAWRLPRVLTRRAWLLV